MLKSKKICANNSYDSPKVFDESVHLIALA